MVAVQCGRKINGASQLNTVRRPLSPCAWRILRETISQSAAGGMAQVKHLDHRMIELCINGGAANRGAENWISLSRHNHRARWLGLPPTDKRLESPVILRRIYLLSVEIS